ncbi:hypothetical protein WDW89_17980 [Deltaproteobacteria bacterium TL4]
MNKQFSFKTEDLKSFEPDAKVGLLATVSPDELPHITLITSLQAKTPSQLMFAQFIEGVSKEYVQHNPKTGFLIMSLDRKLWRGKARWTHLKKEGEDYQLFNNKPMFRYNTYFGIHTVHYLDLVETYGKEDLPLLKILSSALVTKSNKAYAMTTLDLPRPLQQPLNALNSLLDSFPLSPVTRLTQSLFKESILKPWAQGLFNKLTALKFISFLDHEGFPVLVPLFQCQAADSRRLVFSPFAYENELRLLKKETPVAVFGLTMNMESILVRGIFQGFKSYAATNLGAIDIDWVYNSMPPKQGQVYPSVPIKAVVDF